MPINSTKEIYTNLNNYCERFITLFDIHLLLSFKDILSLFLIFWVKGWIGYSILNLLCIIFCIYWCIKMVAVVDWDKEYFICHFTFSLSDLFSRILSYKGSIHLF